MGCAINKRNLWSSIRPQRNRLVSIALGSKQDVDAAVSCGKNCVHNFSQTSVEYLIFLVASSTHTKRRWMRLRRQCLRRWGPTGSPTPQSACRVRTFNLCAEGARNFEFTEDVNLTRHREPLVCGLTAELASQPNHEGWSRLGAGCTMVQNHLRFPTECHSVCGGHGRGWYSSGGF